jgi:hypothetical protein
LQRELPINSIPELHKEKEMADFRKLVLALAVVALLLGFVPAASAQAPAFTCVANAGTPPTVRSEGLTELVGDLVLSCTGGTPTQAGQFVPQVNIQLFLNTNITSRLVGGEATAFGGTVFNEALLIIDEPNSANNPTRPLLNCGAAGTGEDMPGNGGPGTGGPGVCGIRSTGNPVQTYDGTPGVSNAYGQGRPNVFQGRQAPSSILGSFTQNSIAFLGVPLDPPGTTTTRTLRFTNVRGNANQLGVASSLTGFSAISMSISISGATSVAISQQQQIVAFILPGLSASAGPVRRLVQCNDANWSRSAGAATNQYVACDLVSFLGSFGSNYSSACSNSGRGDNDGVTNLVNYREGFASAFKVRNFRQYSDNRPGVGFGVNTAGWRQNVPGAIYFSEDGFNNATLTEASPNPNVTTLPFQPAPANETAATVDFANAGPATGFSAVGFATQGTRVYLALSNVQNGVTLRVPNRVPLFRAGTTTQTGLAVLIPGASGAGMGGTPTTGAAGGFTTLGISTAGTALAVYEVTYTDVFAVEELFIPIGVHFLADPVADLPTPGLVTRGVGGFAPFYTAAAARVAQSDASGLGTPRFVPSTTAFDLYTVTKCFCNILFPFVTNQQGYDTGIVIANTSRDPFGTSIQTGRVTLFYYGGGPSGAAAPASQTSTAISGGQYLAFTLSGGGTNGIDNRAAGFEGYIIAQSEFQYCHAVAYISAFGASATTPGANQMYVALILDRPGLYRTGIIGESLGH